MRKNSPTIFKDIESFDDEYLKEFNERNFSIDIINNKKILYLFSGIFIVVFYLLHKYRPNFVIKRKMVDGTTQIIYSKVLIWSVIITGIIGGSILYFGKSNKFVKDILEQSEESI